MLLNLCNKKIIEEKPRTLSQTVTKNNWTQQNDRFAIILI